MHFTSYFPIFKQLLREDFINLRKTFLDGVINMSIWISCTIFVLGYLTADQFNISDSFGMFMFVGCIASMGLFESYPAVFRLVADFSGERSINYYLTLPIPSWLIFVKIMVYIAIRCLLFTVVMLPLGKIILWNTFTFANTSWIQFILMLLVSNLFFGAFPLLMASFTKNTSALTNVWTRFIFPMWFLGGFQYSWQSLFALSSTIGYIALANPMVYVMEGTRGAFFGQSGYINVWFCILILAVLTVLCCWLAIRRIKKQLDFV